VTFYVFIYVLTSRKSSGIYQQLYRI